MRVRTIACGVFLLLSFARLAAAENNYPKLRELYANKRYFELRDELQSYRDDKSAELFFYRGAVSNKFNQPQASIYFFRNYMKQAKESDDSYLLIESYEMMADNYRKTYQYRKAAEACTTLLTRFGHKINNEDREDYENGARLWGALGKVPSQTAVIKGNSNVKKDREGQIPIELNNQKVSFIFDTGANLSVITRSLATKLSLKVIDTSIDVTAIAGNKVKARLAVAQKMRIGNVTINNAVFLVFDDKDLYVSEANYQINGLIGFPVIAALKEVTFVRNVELFIPGTPAKRGQQNMCLDGFSPLIAGWFKGKRLIFALDSGADDSVLYPPFYKEYEDEIKLKYDPHTERMIGVGGFREVKGYLAKNILMQFSGKDVRIPQIPILTEYTTENSRHLYGNLGQDLITHFEKMTLNFEAMSIVFE